MKKNIWIINQYASPPKYEVRPRNNIMAKYLIKAGYEVSIFCASKIHNTDIDLITDGSWYNEEIINNIKFVYINTNKYNSNGIARVQSIMKFQRRVIKYATQAHIKPDIVIGADTLYLYPSLFAPYAIKKKYDSKLVMEVRDLWPESLIAYGYLSKNNPLSRYLYSVEKKCYEYSDNIVFSMKGGSDYIKNKGWDKANGGSINIDKTVWICNGVELDTFYENVREYNFEDEDLDDDKKFKVIYTGSIREANNVNEILDAARLIKNKDIQFLLWGNGDEIEKIKKRITDEKITNVKYKGSVEKKYVPYILSKGNLFLLNYASIKNNEMAKYGTSQNKLFEYLAAGRPVICNFNMGYSFFNGSNIGVAKKMSSAEEYAKEIEKYIQMSRIEYQNVCVNARSIAQEYDYKALTDKLIKIIEDR